MPPLCIPQEYLLCAVNEKGKFSPLNRRQPLCFVAAALYELRQSGCLALQQDKAGVTAPLPGALFCLKPMYDFFDRPRPMPLARLLADFDPAGPGPKLAELAETVGESLEALGLAAPARALGGRVYYIPAPGQSRLYLGAAAAELLGEAPPGGPRLALAQFLQHSGVFAQKLPPFEADKTEKTLAALAQTGAAAQAREMIRLAESCF